MASRATEPATCPDSTPPESLVPACMFAPDQGSSDDPSGGEGFEDGEGTNGDSVDHLDLSNKVGPFLKCILGKKAEGVADKQKVAVVGNVDAGKSTLLGVLTHGELDNGRGFARQKLFRHKHEMESGRTSSVGNDILGFDQEGQVVNKPDSHGGGLDWTKICEKSSKVITFIDLAGHEKYLKTTVFGMTGHLPDFCMLMVSLVGSNAGIVGMTKEHLGLALALNVPVFVVVTKIDMCPANILQGKETHHNMNAYLS
ncbi:GTP-binding protein 1 [Xenoophorus captivus]|uniref:GTP-binding protein 1 n=1 Tax=Xenoophorus captivus TaxID=1517983 RepID=A0ABV0QRX7_9TELE